MFVSRILLTSLCLFLRPVYLQAPNTNNHPENCPLSSFNNTSRQPIDTELLIQTFQEDKLKGTSCFANSIKHAVSVTYPALKPNFMLHFPHNGEYVVLSEWDRDEFLKRLLLRREAEGLGPLMFEFYKGNSFADNEKHFRVVFNSEAFSPFRENAAVQEIEWLEHGQGLKILKLVGLGSMGRVFLVEEIASKKRFALKALPKQNIVQFIVSGLVNEQKILQRLDSPWTTKTHRFFSSPAYTYFLMDFYEGGSLENHLSKVGRLKESAVQFYAAELFLAIDYLHNQLNVVHHDLHPDNLLLDGEGHLSVNDFGIALFMRPGEISSRVMGLPHYLSPEIAAKVPHDRSVDVWAAAVVLFRMAFGELPFDGAQDSDVLFNVVNKGVEFPATPETSPQLRDLLLQMLQKDPAKRLGYKNVTEVMNHAFFDGFNWQIVKSRRVKGPILPTFKQDSGFSDDRFYVENSIGSFGWLKRKIFQRNEQDRKLVCLDVS